MNSTIYYNNLEYMETHFQTWSAKMEELWSDDFYYEYQEWIIQDNGQCNHWINEAHKKGWSLQKTKRIIERAFNIYLKSQQS